MRDTRLLLTMGEPSREPERPTTRFLESSSFGGRPVTAGVRRQTQMSNPYASPNIGVSHDPVHGIADSNLVRGLTFAICGYVAPFLILVPMFCIKFGVHPIEQINELYGGLAAWHWPVNVTGCLLLMPNYVCLLLFGFSGYKRGGFISHLGPHSNGASMGVATLLGYFVMLVFSYVFDPFQYWPAELTAFTQSVIALAFPIVLVLYCALSRAVSILRV